ncbi:MAG: ADP-ribosylglycohydrolase family protein [Paludibacter sp.]|nr:ADP-ribosylglycohydrolase family protein [Paludibacter sp.]
MKKITLIFLVAIIALSCAEKKKKIAYNQPYTIAIDVLKDKIKGGWAGQTIGCTFGGPTEFKYRGAIIHDQQPIIWYDDYARETFEIDPGLYDDVYMDLTFVEIINKYGLDVHVDSFALAFANADYKLWHANQAARYNILNGIMPPASGHWMNNPHADDIDFQIEADFIGMMTPGMVNTSSEIADKIGHIMNYGDGWYGGVYISAMYSLAFVSDDIRLVVSEALKTIPPKSKFALCIADVIALHKKYPTDWKRCWREIEQNHAFEIGCPEGVFNAFNIDATLNSAYVVMGLLYGNGDFYTTMDIATRAGQDSDCNPASAAGVLGVMYGYSKIPQYWKPALEKVEDLDFPYTSISLNEIYDINLKNIKDVVLKNGGQVDNKSISFIIQLPKEVRWEMSFEGYYPSERRVINKEFKGDHSIKVDFEGTGVVLMGFIKQIIPNKTNYIAHIEAYIDGKKVESFKMPFDYIKRKYDIFHSYNLIKGKHSLEIKWLNPHPHYVIQAKDLVVYTDKAVENKRPY